MLFMFKKKFLINAFLVFFTLWSWIFIKSVAFQEYALSLINRQTVLNKYISKMFLYYAILSYHNYAPSFYELVNIYILKKVDLLHGAVKRPPFLHFLLIIMIGAYAA